MTNKIRSVHPFPARMSPDFLKEELQAETGKLRILDPMAGSGTTLVIASLQGHEGIGFDRDPLAVLMANTWLTKISHDTAVNKAKKVVQKAKYICGELCLADAYPIGSDEETKAFIRYWFDRTNRLHLAALSKVISRIRSEELRTIMWCAFSRQIITKSKGVSLAMDVSHSRPHKVFKKAPIKAIEGFVNAVKRVVKNAPFSGDDTTDINCSITEGDARNIPLKSNSIDLVITSPPYLNAIDYLRGHKLSLVWMGHKLKDIREIRSTNVGAERKADNELDVSATKSVLNKMCKSKKLKPVQVGMLKRYISDLSKVISESRRVLKKGGRAIFVVGNCNLRNVYVKNSTCVIEIAKKWGFEVSKIRRRALPNNRRYLPSPNFKTAGKSLKKRMREEVIITLINRR